MQKNKNEQIFNAALYARLSREDGDKGESDSIVNQKDLIKDFLKSKPEIQLISERVDDGYSGVTFDRPALNAMLDDVRSGEINCIVVKDLSRFGRNYIEAGRYIRTLFPLLGVRFIAINDGYDSADEDNAANHYILPFKNIINDAYCADISKKVRSQLEVKRRKGDYIGAFVPFGYLRSSENKNKLVVDKVAAEVVREVFRCKITGMSYQKIADKLNSLGVPSPLEYKQSTGMSCSSALKVNPTAKWSPNAIQRILYNEVYTGTLVQGKMTTPNYKVKSKIVKDKSEWVRVENAHEAIISKEKFELVASLLNRDTRTAPNKTTAYPFSGMVFCSRCEQSMVRKVTHGKSASYYFYVCTRTHKKDKREGCAGIRISEPKLFKAVTLVVRNYIKGVLDMDEALQVIDELPGKEADVKKLQHQIGVKKEEIDKLNSRKVRLYEDFTDGEITRGEYELFKKNYDLQIGEAETAVENLQNELAQISGEKSGSKGEWLEYFREYRDFTELSRELIVKLIDKIIVYEGGRLEVIFRYKDALSESEGAEWQE